MVLIKWSSGLSVGIKKIDSQHEYFVRLINSTYDSVENNDNYKVLKEIPELINYARTHFAAEEEVFEKYNYPFTTEHKKEHVKLTEKAISFYDRAQKGENIGEEFLEYLKDWLENHLKTHDFKYAKYFKENKIKVE